MKTISKATLAGVALAASLLAAAPVAAQDVDETVTRMVAYHDLDLSTDAGIDTLNARLRRAARYACGMDIREPGRTTPTRQARDCYADNMRRSNVRVAALVRQANLGG